MEEPVKERQFRDPEMRALIWSLKKANPGCLVLTKGLPKMIVIPPEGKPRWIFKRRRTASLKGDPLKGLTKASRVVYKTLLKNKECDVGLY